MLHFGLSPLRMLLPRVLAALFLLCRLGLLLWLFLLGLLFLLGGLSRFLLLSWLRLLFLLCWLGLVFALLLLREGRNSRPQKQEQCCCADDSKCFHECRLHYREFMRPALAAWRYLSFVRGRVERSAVEPLIARMVGLMAEDLFLVWPYSPPRKTCYDRRPPISVP